MVLTQFREQTSSLRVPQRVSNEVRAGRTFAAWHREPRGDDFLRGRGGNGCG